MTTRSFKRRLLRDTAGNTLAIMAAAMLPLMGMVGSAIDMSRLYLVKSRLQQACDSGALAARRTMTNSTLDANARTQAQNFFSTNLREGTYQATNVTFAVADVMNGSTATGRVAGTASARLPMSIMHMFGIAPFTLQATCEAELNVTNNDVMFVLDVTGSMACLPADTEAACQTYTNANTVTNPTTGQRRVTEQANSRIVGLRAAVKSFYTALNAATSAEARLRIGFVPYSSGMNVGGILPAGTMRTNQLLYQTRRANMTTPVYNPSFGNWSNYGNTETYGRYISSDNCNNYGNNVAFTQDGIAFSPASAGNPTPEFGEVVGGAKPADATQTQFRRQSNAYSGNASCQREKRTRPVSYATTAWAFASWNYRDWRFNLSSPTLTMATAVSSSTRANFSGTYTLPELAQMQSAGTASGVTTQTVTRDNCIEERETGMDDISLLATNDATRWAPAWPWLTYYRNGVAEETITGSYQRPADIGGYACPRSAQRLGVLTQAQVDAYVDDPAFVPSGATYHDIGMIWGTRLMSPTGVFSADHAAAPNGRPVARHIIFMTDGEMKPGTLFYSPYAVERNSRRRQPTGTLTEDSLKIAHNNAFLAACAAARGPANVTVWVVAFGQALTPDLEACAGDTTRTFESTDSATLNSQFQSIARRIAELRLSQ